MRIKSKIKMNLTTGILSQVLLLALGIILPRLTLVSYGSEINGLLSSVSQIYSYIGLLEAGVGGATVQALYKAVGLTDKAKICAIIAATSAYYKRTGALYFFSIIIFAGVYPCFIKSDIPWLTIVLVIVLEGLGNVINYFFQGKYLLLFQAEGKNYIQVTLNTTTNLLRQVAKIVLMYHGFDVVLVQALACVMSITQMIVIVWYVHKYYQWLNLDVKPDFKAISQSRNVLVHQLSTLVFNSTDNITLTIFCGLKAVSVYSMYTMLYGIITRLISVVSSSVAFKLGHSYNLNHEHFLKLFNIFETFYFITIFSAFQIATYFILPFMKLYTAGINDVNYIDVKLSLLFTVYMLLSGVRAPVSQVINIAGHFKQTQYRSILEATINLIVSLIAVNSYGIYGVLIGTIVALIYRSNDQIIYASKHILHRSVFVSYGRILINGIVFIVIYFISKNINMTLDNYINIFVFCIFYSLIVIAGYIIVNIIFCKELFVEVYRMLKK